jgi:peptide/nickel transport system substrate-binding protein
MRLRKPAVAASAAVLLVLAACGGSSTHSAGTPSTTRSGSGTTAVSIAGRDAHVQPPAAPIAGAKRGGTLTVLSDHIDGPFDPTESYWLDSTSILSGLVVRSLTQYVYDPDSKAMILIPDLATDLGRPSPDFMSWRFTLRRGVKFENGRPVTAADVKYGIERSFDRKTFPDGPAYSNEYFLNGDTYQGPYRSPGRYAGVTVHGRTITIHMSKPFPDMSYWASFPAISPIPPGKASDPATYQNHPWATGPYMFKPGGYKPNKSLVLVQNPYWDPHTDPGRHQYVNQIDFNVHTTRSRIDQVMLADTGTAKTTVTNLSVLPDDYRRFSQQAGDRLILGSQPCTYFWFPDNRKITDIKVRRALGYAFPFKAYWTAIGEIPGVTILPASNVMPPGTPGRIAYNPLPGDPSESGNPTKAKALLTAAGKLHYPIRFAYDPSDPFSASVKDVLVRVLPAAGFDPQPVVTDALYPLVSNPKAGLNLRLSPWCADWPSGSSWFPALFGSTDIASSGLGMNWAAFSSKRVDDRIEAIPHLLLTEQPPAWNALDTLIQTRYYPVVVTGYGGVAMMRGSKVHGAVDDTVFGMPTWKDIWLG